MRCLLIHAHPDPDSFSTALRTAAVEGLNAGGHHVDVIDLYAIGYRAAMTSDEHRDYDNISAEHPDPQVTEHIALLREAQALIFVYPTWWSGPPAIMKAWLDRTLLPGVAFTLDESTNKVKPGLKNVKHLVGITTTGSPSWFVRGVGNAGRRTIMQTVRVVCHWRCRRRWYSLASLDTSTAQERTVYLAKVRDGMASL